MKKNKIKEYIRKNFQKINKNSKENKIFKEIRERSFEFLYKSKLYSLNKENYKHTSILEKLNNQIKTSKQDNKNTEKIELKDINFEEKKNNEITIINGKFIKKYSKIKEKKNISILHLNKSYEEKKNIIEKYFGKQSDYRKDIFIALNNVLFKNGIFIEIKENKKNKYPIIINNITNDDKKKNISYIRIFIIIKKNSEADIVEISNTLNKNKAFSNLLTETIILENSNLNYYKIQNKVENLYQINNNQFYQKKNSKLNVYTITFNGIMIKNNLNIIIDDEKCKSNIYGLYFSKNKEHIDNQTLVDHKKQNSESNEIYKGIITDESKSIFKGKIYVRKGAKNTNAFQLNKNILLSNKCSINTSPQLKIWNNDVKCSHGVTTGKINEKQLFYLKSRGISEKNAYKILIKAFASEIIEKIKIKSLNEYLKKSIEKYI